MDACEISCAAARAPFLRNEIHVVHYRPGKEREKVGSKNEPNIVCMVFEDVAGFCVQLGTQELMLNAHRRKCVGGVGNHDTRKLMLTIHSARYVNGVECTCCSRLRAAIRFRWEGRRLRSALGSNSDETRISEFECLQQKNKMHGRKGVAEIS